MSHEYDFDTQRVMFTLIRVQNIYYPELQAHACVSNRSAWFCNRTALRIDSTRFINILKYLLRMRLQVDSKPLRVSNQYY
jgi:hypothetical protein